MERWAMSEKIEMWDVRCERIAISEKWTTGNCFVMETDGKFYPGYRKLQKQLFDLPNKTQFCIFLFDTEMLMGAPLIF